MTFGTELVRASFINHISFVKGFIICSHYKHEPLFCHPMVKVCTKWIARQVLPIPTHLLGFSTAYLP